MLALAVLFLNSEPEDVSLVPEPASWVQILRGPRESVTVDEPALI